MTFPTWMVVSETDDTVVVQVLTEDLRTPQLTVPRKIYGTPRFDDLVEAFAARHMSIVELDRAIRTD